MIKIFKPEKMLLDGERVVSKLGALSLTDRKLIMRDVALLKNFNIKSGCAEVNLDKVDSVRLEFHLNRALAFLYLVSRKTFLWSMLFLWAVPYFLFPHSHLFYYIGDFVYLPVVLFSTFLITAFLISIFCYKELKFFSKSAEVGTKFLNMELKELLKGTGDFGAREIGFINMVRHSIDDER